MNRQWEEQIDLGNAGNLYGPFDVAELDDLHYRFERQLGTSALTAVVEIGRSLTMTDEPHDWADAVMTETGTTTVDVSNAASLYLRVKTAQAGYTGLMHLYARTRPIAGA